MDLKYFICGIDSDSIDSTLFSFSPEAWLIRCQAFGFRMLFAEVHRKTEFV